MALTRAQLNIRGRLPANPPTLLSAVEAPPEPMVPSLLNPVTSMAGLVPHKGHFHIAATGQKVAGPGVTTGTPGERLFAHKDHFHTEQTATTPTIKVSGPGVVNEDTGQLEYGHKGHAHDVAGTRIPGSTNPDTPLTPGEESLPTEEDVVQASIEEQRRQIRRRAGRGRLSTIMHGRAGNVLG